MRLKGLHAVVTGAGSGIGEAIAVLFAKEGARVAVIDIDLPSARNTVERIQASGGMAEAFQADVSEEKEVISVFNDIRQGWNKIDVLVNDAGIGIAAKAADTQLEDWERVMAVNARGTFLCCKQVLPIMEKQGGGSIVNIASIAGVVGVNNRAVYCASKGAVISLTQSIAIDYADKGIRCNAISPGTVDSPWIGKILSTNPDPVGTRKIMEERQPIGRMGTPQEIANTALFLASPESSFATGSNLIMDGGLTAR